MTIAKQRIQHCRPCWITSLDKNAHGKLLTRLDFTAGSGLGDGKYDEAWLQELLHRFPECLPVDELEPGLGPLIPIGMEVPTATGYIDNLFVTGDGNIVLVECKLWRNPEARRRVLSQIIDYAQGLSRWRYSEFDAAVRKSLDARRNLSGKSLLELLGQDDIDEQIFVDSIQRNLRMGRILLLVVGDGIREDTESLAEYLQMHAGFHFMLALIQVAVFRAPEGSYIVQPRVLARTLNVERAVVRLASDSIVAEATPEDAADTGSSRAMSLTEEIFFDRLRLAAPDTADALQAFRRRAEEKGLQVFLSPATKSVSLKWEAMDGRVYSFGGVTLGGMLSTYSISWVPNAVGRIDLAQEYLFGLARLVHGSVKKTKDPTQWYVVTKPEGTALPAALDVLMRADEWIELIQSYQSRLTEATAGSTLP